MARRRTKHVVEMFKTTVKHAVNAAMAGGATKLAKSTARNAGDIATLAKGAPQLLRLLAGAPMVAPSRKKKTVAGGSTLAPVSIGSRITSYTPSVSTTSAGSRVRNRELINGQLGTSSSFTVQNSYSVNPGLSSVFTWLSNVAKNYETYRVHAMRWVFIPLNNTSASGDIIMWADYNATDPPLTTEAQAYNHAGCYIGSVWEAASLSMRVKEMHALGPRKFVRTTAIAGDLKTYDVGQFNIATVNNASLSYAGKLLCEYDVEFFTPQTVPSTALTPSYTSIGFSNANQTISTGTGAIILFQNFGVSTSGSFDPLNFWSGYSAGTFTPPAGCYRITFNATLEDTSAEDYSGFAYFNVAGAQYPAAGYQADFNIDSAAGDLQIPVSYSAIVPLNGTQTFSVVIDMTGAAGTLEALAKTTSISISLA